MIPITSTISIGEHEVVNRFVRAKGPGGQNARKEATAVELRLDIGRSSLPRDVQERLIALAGRHVTSRRILVVVSRTFRSQVANREAARARLVGLLRRAATPRKPRKPTKPNRVELRDRMIAKERHSALKRARHGLDDDGEVGVG